MGKLLNYCQTYAARFSQNSPNLLFMGHTGLGKTHLALAIADAVLEGGHDVLYTSAAALAAQLGREHFDYSTKDEWLAACQEADLLILDDLGTEFNSSFFLTNLYSLLNNRLGAKLPTIVTTKGMHRSLESLPCASSSIPPLNRGIAISTNASAPDGASVVKSMSEISFTAKANPYIMARPYL